MNQTLTLEVNPACARKLLATSFEGEYPQREGRDVDSYAIEYEMSDEEVLEWLKKVLAGHQLSAKVTYHEDGTTTYEPCIRG